MTKTRIYLYSALALAALIALTVIASLMYRHQKQTEQQAAQPKVTAPSTLFTTITVGNTASLATHTCTAATTVTMVGVTPDSSLAVAPTTDISGVTGWGPPNSLWLTILPGTDKFSWRVCNNANGAVKPSAAVTFNVALLVPGSTTPPNPIPPNPTPTACGVPPNIGNNTDLKGYTPFPASNVWNQDISNAPLDPQSATITSSPGFSGNHLHHDWSSVSGGNYGIPYTVVDTATQAMVPVTVNQYPQESDVTYMPLPANLAIEGTPADCSLNGDQHSMVLDRRTCFLYELYNTRRCNGAITAGSTAIWDMLNYEQRPYGWTSVDAAGLPVFAGLVRYDEIVAGSIDHALRFTLSQTKNNANNGYFVLPATHAAGSLWGTNNVMGMRIRLKSSFNISGFSQTNQIILKAMQKYGMILADNGSNFYFQGVPDNRWNDDDLRNLDSVQSSNFEVVQATPPFPGWDANTAPKGTAPIINSFTASASTVKAGTSVTLNWTATGSTYEFIDKLGGVRAPSVTFTPTATATYTLSATNYYGRATKQLTVTVTP